MGQDKALLQVDGQPLLVRTCQIAAAICNPVAVVTPWVDRYRPVLPKTIHLIQEPYPDHSRSAGPLMGFFARPGPAIIPMGAAPGLRLTGFAQYPFALLGRKPDDPTRRNPGLRAPITPGMGTVVRFLPDPEPAASKGLRRQGGVEVFSDGWIPSPSRPSRLMAILLCLIATPLKIGSFSKTSIQQNRYPLK